MSYVDSKATSRPSGVAEALVGHPVNKTEVMSRKVVLTGDREILVTENGRTCFLDCLRLLPRVAGRVEVQIPDGLGSLEEEIRALVATAWRIDALEADHYQDGIERDVQAILSVGFRSRQDLPWVTVNSNGWIARVAARGEELSRDTAQTNPVGALMAASLGVAEVFKLIYEVPVDVAPPITKSEFSLYDYSTSPSDPGPSIPQHVSLADTLLIGAGAIGNGVALLLSQFNLSGRLHVIDKQDYGTENFGTCVLLDRDDWIGSSKAECLADWLKERSALQVSGEQGLIGSARSGLSVKSMNVDLVLNGLDEVPARHDAQFLWPSVLIDGGINAIGAGVVTHRLDHPEGACLRCTFSVLSRDEKVSQSIATGLSRSSLESDLGRALTETDIEGAEESKRPWLRAKLADGKTLCATITEAQSELQLGIEIEEGFRPSAPFVATASAAMMVGEMLKALVYPNAKFNQSFQLANLFLGPSSSVVSLRKPDPACECVTHRDLVMDLASRRRQTVEGATGGDGDAREKEPQDV
jgi:hypothetical protein